MKFLSIYKNVERNTPPTPEEMATMGKLVEAGIKEGWLLSHGRLPAEQTWARGCGDRVATISVTDGPFTEAKEVGRRIRHPEGELQGRGDPAGEGFPQGCR